jgi:hypothetical protein
MSKQGAHVREKVLAGLWNRPTDGIKCWSIVCKLLEEEYPSFAAAAGIDPVLPWARGRVRGNVCKALYMSLMHSYVKGCALLEFTEDVEKSFYKISRVMVPGDQRIVFDSGMFPSVESLKAKTFDDEAAKKANIRQVKTLQKQWETAGFNETLVNGNVVFTFNFETYKKQKVQQSRVATV